MVNLIKNYGKSALGNRLVVAYYRRSLPYFLKVKELIESGKCGRIRLINIKLLQPARKEDYNRSNPPWRVKKEIAGGGYFYDMASHQMDLMYYLFGEVMEISGKSFNMAGLYDVEDTVVANMVFKNGIIFSGIWSFTTPVSASSDVIEIVGEKGVISFSTFDKSPVTIDSYELKASYNIDHPENIQFYMIQSVVNELLGDGECPSTGESAIYTNWLMDNILKRI